MYTLSEIGEFVRAVVDKKIDTASEHLSLLWMGSNLTHEGLQETIDGFDRRSAAGVNVASPGQQKIANDWKRMMCTSQT